MSVVVCVMIKRNVYKFIWSTKQEDTFRLEYQTQLPEEPYNSRLCTMSDSETFYYVPKSSPKLLWRWKTCNKELGTKCIEFEHTPHHIIHFQNKIYGFWMHSMKFFCYDPLCSVLEEFNVHLPICAAYPLSSSAVVIEADQTHELFLYHFNTSEMEAAIIKRGIILGYLKHNIVVNSLDTSPSSVKLLSAEANTLISITSDDANLYLNANAVSVGDEIFYYNKTCNHICRSKLQSLPIEFEGIDNDIVLHVTREKEEDDANCLLCLCELEDNNGLTLDCGHQFHKECIEQWVSNWDNFEKQATHIVFTHALCPGGCKHLVRHPNILQSRKIYELFTAVEKINKEILPTLDPTKVDDDILTYICYVCHKPFYGGERVCSRMLTSEPHNDPEELRCEECQDDFRCPVHDREFVIYKCAYCCNPATHRSFATRYMCDRCDERWKTAEPMEIVCSGSECCPLMGVHKRKGAYPLGCFLCMSSTELNVDKICSFEISPEQTPLVIETHNTVL